MDRIIRNKSIKRQFYKNHVSNHKQRMLDPMEKSRMFFILEGITGIGQYSLATGAFLAGFISFLGGSETLNGSIGVVPAAVGVFQLLSGLILKGGKNRKQEAIKVAFLLRFLLSSIYFIPFIMMKLNGSKEMILTTFVVCYIGAFMSNGLIAPMISGWLVDVSPLSIRGKYLAKRDKISLTIIALTTIILGRVLDYNKAADQEFTGFIVVGIVLSMMGILNIYSLYNIEDINKEVINHDISFFARLALPIKDEVFRKIIVFYVLWNIALFIGLPYFAVYMVEKLHLSYTYMMAMSVIGSIIRVLFSSFWGSHADKKSWFSSASFSLIVLAITHISWGLVVPENQWLLVPLLSITNGIAWAGVAISLFNIQFLFAKKEIRTVSISVNAAIGGTMSIAAVKVGGLIVERGEYALNVFGHNFNGFQLTFILSGILLLGCVLFIQKILVGLAHHIDYMD